MSDAPRPTDNNTEAEPTPTDDPKPTNSPSPTDDETDDPPEETTTDKEPDKTTTKPPDTTTDKPPEETTKADKTTDENGKETTSIVVITKPASTSTRPDGTIVTPTDTSQNDGNQDKDSDGGGLPQGGKIAIAVVVPVVAVALLLVAGIWFWKRRKAQKDAEEERRKEVEDYAYNPNADPTLPPVGGLTSESPYDMREDNASSGYRGWGSTAVGAVGAKAASGHTGAGYSDSTNRRNPSDGTRSGDIMMDSRDGAYSPESGEILGAMGPSAAGNRTDIRRGPSNASSQYSAGGRSDGSGGANDYANQYYDQYTGGNPYAGDAYGGQQRPAEVPGAAVIRDNPARRNTRIENPSHYPQQSAGISQNF